MAKVEPLLQRRETQMELGLQEQLIPPNTGPRLGK